MHKSIKIYSTSYKNGEVKIKAVDKISVTRHVSQLTHQVLRPNSNKPLKCIQSDGSLGGSTEYIMVDLVCMAEAKKWM